MIKISNFISTIILSIVSLITTFSHATEILSYKQHHWAELVNENYNLYRITPSLYRSSKLNQEAIPLLKEQGIVTIINLRTFNDDKDILRNTTIRHIDIPMLAWHIKDDDIIKVLRTIRSSEKYGAVLFHCQHGADRTGIIAAMYRIVFQGWSKEQALEELKKGGYGFHSIWFNISRYVRNTNIEEIRASVMQYNSL